MTAAWAWWACGIAALGGLVALPWVKLWEEVVGCICLEHGDEFGLVHWLTRLGHVEWSNFDGC